MTKKSRKSRLWEFDPTLFQSGPKAGFFERHILDKARSLGKYSIYVLAFSYPVVLVILGVMFGGLVFWSSFAGSVAIIWILLKMTGYARTFASWDVGYASFVGLVGAFAVAAAFFLGLSFIKIWTFPIFGTILVVAFIIAVKKIANR